MTRHWETGEIALLLLSEHVGFGAFRFLNDNATFLASSLTQILA